jgi:DNA mismatch repair protein MutL
LLVVERAEHGVLVEGLVAPPDLVRGNRDDVLLVVNGRPVRDPALVQAILEAYRPLLARDRYPLAAIHLRLDPADVDVNVHPTKAVVRFRHPRLLNEMLVTAIREALGRSEVVPAARTTSPAPDVSLGMSAAVPPAQTGLFAEEMAPYTPALFGRVLGQVQETFIVSTSEREVFFLDQHVAEERVIFDRLQADLRRGPLASQTLLFADPLNISPAAQALLDRWRESLERLGFAFTEEGGGLALTAVPTLLKAEDPARLIEAAADDLGGARVGAPALDRALAFVACRAAVKAETRLSREEMERIVSDLALTTSPYFCPHGRPIVSRVSLSEIRRELRRTW